MHITRKRKEKNLIVSDFSTEKKPGFSSALLLSIPVKGISFSMKSDDPRRVFLR